MLHLYICKHIKFFQIGWLLLAISMRVYYH